MISIKSNITKTPSKVKNKLSSIISNLSTAIDENKRKSQINKERAKDKQLREKNINEMSKSFYRLMYEFKLINSFKETFIIKLETEDYGFSGTLEQVPGVTFAKLKNFIVELQQQLGCIWIMKETTFKTIAEIKIVTKPLDTETPYKCPRIKPWEMYLGLDFLLKPILVNVNKYCMFMIGGATGAGKTRFIYTILLSWIIGVSPRELEIFIADTAKNEFPQFKYIPHVKGYAEELAELDYMMRYLREEIARRKAEIKKYREEGKATNIEEYNAIKTNAKMKYCFTIIDEFSTIVPDNSDSVVEKKMKLRIIDTLKLISKIGRSLGIFTILCTQKTTKEEIPPILKNMSAVRISFRANDEISSEVIIGDKSAVGLLDRYGVYSINGGADKEYLFSPKLTTEYMNKELLKHTDKTCKKIDFVEMYESNKNNNVSNVTPIKEEEEIVDKKEYDYASLILDDEEEMLSIYNEIDEEEGEMIDY